MNICIINYGMGNIRSVQKAFNNFNVTVRIEDNPLKIKYYDKLVLPGVGHFAQGIKNIQQLGFGDELLNVVLYQKTPILGICLGMQLFTKYSEEGDLPGLGLVNATVHRFPQGGLKIPHIGWNSIRKVKQNTDFDNFEEFDTVYFVHSYYVKCMEKNDILYETDYGITFHSAFEHDNIIGFQFHPEKSHDIGLKLISSFIKL